MPKCIFLNKVYAIINNSITNNIGAAIGYTLYALTIVNGVGISYAIDIGVHEAFDKEVESPTMNDLVKDFILEVSPIEIPSFLEFLLTYLKESIDLEHTPTVCK